MGWLKYTVTALSAARSPFGRGEVSTTAAGSGLAMAVAVGAASAGGTVGAAEGLRTGRLQAVLISSAAAVNPRNNLWSRA